MTWLQLDDNMPEHPKIVGLSSDAFRLHVRGLAYCCRLLTDGKIPDGAILTLLSHVDDPNENGQEIVRELESHRLWRRTKKGIKIVDYLDWNPSREEIEARREAKKAGGRKGAKARWGDGSTHSITYGSTNGRPHGERNAPLPSTSSYEVPQEDLKDEADHNAADAIYRLLETTGQEQGQHAHLELLSMLAQGATAWDFDTARTATIKARPKHPWNYARIALRNRLANKEPAA